MNVTKIIALLITFAGLSAHGRTLTVTATNFLVGDSTFEVGMADGSVTVINPQTTFLGSPTSFSYFSQEEVIPSLKAICAAVAKSVPGKLTATYTVINNTGKFFEIPPTDLKLVEVLKDGSLKDSIGAELQVITSVNCK